MDGINLALRTVNAINDRMNPVSRTVHPICGRVNLTCWTFNVIGWRDRVAKTTLKAVIHQLRAATALESRRAPAARRPHLPSGHALRRSDLRGPRPLPRAGAAGARGARLHDERRRRRH